MKYIVITPQATMICFNEASQVANFCMEIENNNLDKFALEEGLTYETMTPVEIGFAYNAAGTQEQSCMVYETKEVIAAMKSEAVEQAMIDEALAFFNTATSSPIVYPTYLDDVITMVTPVPIASICGNVYTMENLSARN
ncbi:MAG: hypothetical protein BEN18_05945 [Epulopiscium sp. Nuni2H_MBin001]|nr:MAG: hypothetical protein BEN18_05945 [Epulopiscium sp. Nuni2H_MBin001]